MEDMKNEVQPKVQLATFSCACGASFECETTKRDNPVKIDICNMCHPFYTGKQKIVDSAGMVDKFNKRYAKK